MPNRVQLETSSAKGRFLPDSCGPEATAAGIKTVDTTSYMQPVLVGNYFLCELKGDNPEENKYKIGTNVAVCRLVGEQIALN